MTPEPSSEEVIRLREELESANRKLADAHKLASLGRLAAGIVHEINSPIGSILSNNEVILRSLDKLKTMLLTAQRESAPPPQKGLDMVEVIAGLSSIDKIACERILNIVRSLKTFARVNESDLEKVSVNDLLRNTVKLASTMYKGRIVFENEFSQLPDVECYPGLLNQVFLNLIINACQAIPEMGAVTSRTWPEPPLVHIAVQDTGTGIPPEVRPRIFSAGFSTKPIGEGTGIGLTISREIVEDTHGGKIKFETEVGKGTTFHVLIPIEQPRSKP